VNVDFHAAHRSDAACDVAGTMLAAARRLAARSLGVDSIASTDEEFVFDDAPIKEELGDLPLSDPDVLKVPARRAA